MDIHAQAPDDYSGSLYLRCPKSLPPAIKMAARQSMTSVSSYVRSAVLQRLKADGCIPANSYGGGGE
jgi:predicted HicB family RNase H-like nuclease